MCYALCVDYFAYKDISRGIRMGMEIERKFLVRKLPEDLPDYPCHRIEQAYLNTKPVVRIRREDDTYYLTYKGDGAIAREEYNLPLNEAAYRHMLPKADGNIITKKRYLIPDGNRTIELDIFDAPLAPLIIAEVEFPDMDAAQSYTPPNWLGEDVTGDFRYSNSYLSMQA